MIGILVPGSAGPRVGTGLGVGGCGRRVVWAWDFFLSLEAELREVLRRAAVHPRTDVAEEFAAIRARTPGKPHRLAEDLVRESRDER